MIFRSCNAGICCDLCLPPHHKWLARSKCCARLTASGPISSCRYAWASSRKTRGQASTCKLRSAACACLWQSSTGQRWSQTARSALASRGQVSAVVGAAARSHGAKRRHLLMGEPLGQRSATVGSAGLLGIVARPYASIALGAVGFVALGQAGEQAVHALAVDFFAQTDCGIAPPATPSTLRL